VIFYNALFIRSCRHSFLHTSAYYPERLKRSLEKGNTLEAFISRAALNGSKARIRDNFAPIQKSFANRMRFEVEEQTAENCAISKNIKELSQTKRQNKALPCYTYHRICYWFYLFFKFVDLRISDFSKYA